MARKLPWLSDTVKKSPSARSDSAKLARRKRARSPEDEGDDVSAIDIASHKRNGQERIARNASSSPPPSPPVPEFMKDGPEGDDRWIQVEDEFLATAKLLTQHLHHAEYQRLKKQARSQNASAIHRISRPVDGRTKLSTESRMKVQGAIQRHNQENAVTNIIGNANLGRRDEPDSDEEDPWMHDPRLAGLMTHRDISTKLATVAGIKSKTRASKGYSQNTQLPGRAAVPESNGISFATVNRNKLNHSSSSKLAEDEDESDYDLDDVEHPAKISRTIIKHSEAGDSSWQKTISRKRSSPLQGMKHNERAGATVKSNEDTSSSHKQSPSKKSSSSSNLIIQASSSDLSFDAFSAFPQRQASSYSERMAKRKAEATKKEKQESRRKSAQLDEIPTFLI